jgi:hypothetical protein
MSHHEIKTHRGKIRRETSGVRRTPEEYEKGLSKEVDRAYDAWLIRNHYPRHDFTPSFSRNAQ